MGPTPSRIKTGGAHKESGNNVAEPNKGRINNRQAARTTSGPPRMLRALYDYEASQDDELSFMKGDKLRLIDDKTNTDWWLAHHVTNGEEGYIPSNFVMDDNNLPETQDWWGKGDRREANRLLMLPGNPIGTFMIRDAKDGKSYALSILSLNEDDEPLIRHYRIRKQRTGVSIGQRTCFPTLNELVSHYNKDADGLCSALTEPCPKQAGMIPFKRLEVDRLKIEIQTKLGQGQFGEVWEARWNRTTKVAVKILKQKVLANSAAAMTADAFLEEAQTMHRLRHRKLVQLMGVCTVDEPLMIITELMIHGSLLSYLRNGPGSDLPQATLIDIGAQVACGMAYLEEQNFVHRDLRAANILIGKDNEAKVADFGLSRLLNSENEYRGNEDSQFPIKWTALEGGQCRKFTVKSDVWSYAVLLHELMTHGHVPYPCMSNNIMFQKLAEGYRMPKMPEYPAKMYQMMLQCWNKKPERRPTFSYLCRFFDDFYEEADRQYTEEPNT